MLHAVAEHGLDHWKHVADYVRSKSQRKCETHYNAVYLDSITAPLPSDAALHALDRVSEPPSPVPAPTPTPVPVATSAATPAKAKAKATSAAGKAGKISDPAVSADAIVPVIATPAGESSPTDGRTVRNNSGNKPSGSLEGFMPLRGDFDVEWDDDAEELIADLVISPDDSPEEVELKARLLDMYDARLKRRDAVKDFLFDRQMLNFTSLKSTDRRGTRDEKELAARLKVFSRLLDKTAYEAFQHSVMTEYRISKDVYKYAQSRKNGVRKLSEVDIYEVERKIRAARLAEAAKPVSKKAGRRKSAAKSSAAPKRDRTSVIRSPASNPIVSLSSSPSPVLCLNSSLNVQCAPLGTEKGTSAGGSESGSVIAVDPTANGDGAGTGVLSESKTAALRKARERKRIMRSPYPQVAAIPINDLEDASELTEKEKTLCSALQIPPKEFLRLRDAMLYTASQDIKRSARSKRNGECRPAYALRATRSRAKGLNGQPDGDDRVNIAKRPMTRSLTAATRVTKPGEVIAPPRYRVRPVKPTPIPDTQESAMDALAHTAIQVTEVEVERVQTRSRAQVAEEIASEAHEINCNEDLKGNGDGQRGKSKREKVTAEIDQALSQRKPDDKLMGSTSDATRRNAADKAKKTEQNLTGDVRIGSRGYRAQPGSKEIPGNGGLHEGGVDNTGDIMAESVGQSGTRLTLTLTLPGLEEQGSPRKPSPRKVTVAIEVTPPKEAAIPEKCKSDAAMCNLAVVNAKQALSFADEDTFETEEVLSSGSAGFSDRSKGTAHGAKRRSLEKTNKGHRKSRCRASKGNNKHASRRIADDEARASSPGVETEILDGSHAPVRPRSDSKPHAGTTLSDKLLHPNALSDELLGSVSQVKRGTAEGRHMKTKRNGAGLLPRSGEEREVGKVIMGHVESNGRQDEEGLRNVAAKHGIRGAYRSPKSEVAACVEFAATGITEEILDEGRADSADRRSSENAFEGGSISSEALDILPRRGEPETHETPGRSEDNYLVIPRRRLLKDSPSPQRKDSPSPQRSTRTSESEGSIRNDTLRTGRKAGERRVRTRLTLSRDKRDGDLELSSGPSSPDAEDSRDEDYDVGSDFEDEPKPAVDSKRLGHTSRTSDVIPTRKSSRLVKRSRRIDESSDVSSRPAKLVKPTGRKRGRPPKSNREKAGYTGGEVLQSARKPPATPVKISSRKRGRPARTEGAKVGPPSKSRRIGSERYSLRRRE